MVKLHIGFDDTDSPNGGCTTYIAALLVEKLSNMNVSFMDYPSLVRLNPNVPWKTRGNGALCLRISCQENSVDKIKETVINTVEANSELDYGGTDPGVVFVHEEVPQDIMAFAKKAEQSMLTIEETLKVAKRVNAEAVGFKKGRGIIGGLAAIGEDLSGDHTFEVIAYRTPENRELPRRVQVLSVKNMDKKSDFTFNNVDPETGRVLITPRGPDPILCGIRGETPEAVKQAYEMIKIDEPVERWMIFRTNQGTDAHLRRVSAVKKIQPYNPVVAQGTVSKAPRIIQGGHVIFAIKDETGEVDCAAYEPTVTLSKIARKLMAGDVLKVYGGVRASSSEHRLTINLEKMRILELVPKVSFVNPSCPECGKRTKSMGKNQGFRCDKCGFRSSQLKKQQVNEERGLEVGLYITSPRSQRHLTKPHCRYGKEKTGVPKELIENWHYP
ncbi:MAG: tRNA(Ile)(2)-agmatinylcytidine synthase [Candidatus Bathyarchaeota archaeon]|nr:tRNA(Ile)(2)-agmatinylcytidine synthase [Candidatus Bathyarchaeum sp.]